LLTREISAAAARLSLLRLPLLRLTLLRRLPLLRLTLLRSLARLGLAWLSLAWLGLTWLGLTLLRLTLFALLRSGFRLGLARGLATLPALRAVLLRSLHPVLGCTLLRGRLRLRALGRAAALLALHALS
jgi:hypothetical protein